MEKARLESPNAIEVVANAKSDQDVEDMVFTQTQEGYMVDEEALTESSNAERIADDAVPADGKEIS